jgi:hypothetical protein
MDERFPRWLRRVVDALSFLSLPNLGPLICGLAVLGFIGSNVLQAPMERFVFDPQSFLQGEYWRIFAFPSVADPLWLLFFCMYVFFVFQLLEQNWGEAPLTVFTFFSYAMALIAAILSGRPLAIWTHVLENISLAVGTLMPELEFRLYFVLPVKAKWLAWLAGAVFLFQFVTGTNTDRLFLFLVLLPYFIFFGPMLVNYVRTRRKIAQNRKRFDDDFRR